MTEDKWICWVWGMDGPDQQPHAPIKGFCKKDFQPPKDILSVVRPCLAFTFSFSGVSQIRKTWKVKRRKEARRFLSCRLSILTCKPQRSCGAKARDPFSFLRWSQHRFYLVIYSSRVEFLKFLWYVKRTVKGRNA